jgi:hypothetical protein
MVQKLLKLREKKSVFRKKEYGKQLEKIQTLVDRKNYQGIYKDWLIEKVEELKI